MQLRRDVQKITTTAKAIRLGEMNRRFLIRTMRKDFVNCSEELNRLTDNFQDSYARTKALEEERQRMISNISHDLRTPLTSMLGYIDALRDDESIEGDEKTEYLRIVSEKGADVNKLIQDIFRTIFGRPLHQCLGILMLCVMMKVSRATRKPNT